MMTTNEEDPEQAPPASQQQQSSTYAAGRFPKWIALAVFSTVAWFAVIGGVQRHQMDSSEKWALSATTLSVVFAVMGVLCYIFARGMFMGQLPEVVLVSRRIQLVIRGLSIRSLDSRCLISLCKGRSHNYYLGRFTSSDNESCQQYCHRLYRLFQCKSIFFLVVCFLCCHLDRWRIGQRTLRDGLHRSRVPTCQVKAWEVVRFDSNLLDRHEFERSSLSSLSLQRRRHGEKSHLSPNKICNFRGGDWNYLLHGGDTLYGKGKSLASDRLV